MNQNEYYKDYTYRGITSKIFIDDAGQCFYATIFDSTPVYFETYGTLESVYESIQYIIDEELDNIYIYQSPYYGAKLKYADHDHSTSKIELLFRGNVVATFDNTTAFDELYEAGRKILDDIFDSKEFKKAEKVRLSKNNLYFHEILEKGEEK